MQRNLGKLTTETYDVLVIGGGIYGAWVAWEATLRGLRTALLEQNDFGHATSRNSQKIVHGGFRYLQHLDVPRVRESLRELQTLMRVAPHLIHPMPFVIPTRDSGLQSRPMMRGALALYNLITRDLQKKPDDPQKRGAPGRLLTREEYLQLAPGTPKQGLTGGAMWCDVVQ